MWEQPGSKPCDLYICLDCLLHFTFYFFENLAALNFDFYLMQKYARIYGIIYNILIKFNVKIAFLCFDENAAFCLKEVDRWALMLSLNHLEPGFA